MIDSPIVQPVERRTVNPYVVGSSPTRGANGRLAQLGERLPYKQNVSGSIPLAPTIYEIRGCRVAAFLCIVYLAYMFFLAFFMVICHNNNRKLMCSFDSANEL